MNTCPCCHADHSFDGYNFCPSCGTQLVHHTAEEKPCYTPSPVQILDWIATNSKAHWKFGNHIIFELDARSRAPHRFKNDNFLDCVIRCMQDGQDKTVTSTDAETLAWGEKNIKLGLSG